MVRKFFLPRGQLDAYIKVVGEDILTELILLNKSVNVSKQFAVLLRMSLIYKRNP